MRFFLTRELHGFSGQGIEMDSIQKLYSDVEKIKKHYRQENPHNYDGVKVCEQVREMFCRTNPALSSLAGSFADYWISTYIINSTSPADEPKQESVQILAAMQSILEGSDEFTECLSQDDWKELCSLTNYEAEDLPIDALNDMMTIFVDKQAWK